MAMANKRHYVICTYVHMILWYVQASVFDIALTWCGHECAIFKAVAVFRRNL